MAKITVVIFTLLFVLTITAMGSTEETTTKVILEEVIVTASRLEEPLRYSPDSVTIITEEEIQKKDKKTVIDVLRDVPGVFIRQNSSFGGSSSIYLRGTNNAHTLIMIDGVRIGDPMAGDGKVSISDLSTDNIERIEIIRGAQSVLYGSDAIGGVVNIITKKGRGKPEFYFSAEGGSFETFREKFGVSGANDKVSYSASKTRQDTKGVSKADKDLGNTEQDYYHDTNISARLDARLSETVKAGFSVRHSQSKMDYDSPGADADTVQDSDIASLSTNLDQDFFAWWQHSIKLGTTETKREYTENGSFDSTYKGTTKLASWQHNFFIKDKDTFTAGFDYQEESGDVQSTGGNITEKKVDTNSLFIQNKWTPLQGFSFTLGMRHDDHQTFGGEDTYKGALAYLYEETGTKIRTSYGTGFRAPSLYQLYSSYGNPNLKPEESKGYDAGIDQELFGKKMLLSVTYFHNDIDNMIDWQWTGPGMWDGKYFNVSKAKTEGWETSIALNFFEWLSFDAHYTYTGAKDETPGGANQGRYLIYRPKHTGGASLNIKPLEKLNVNLNTQYVGKRYRNTSNTAEMPSYTLVNLAASYEVTQWLQVFGRVDNLTDKNYQSIYQYGEPGIGIYGGIKATF
ncbi:MAG: TonB-dependent receptor [Deltaproteobacteria bacterium]|nr:TonB-dependent receptor [Deltaproteobacteria bacterium]